MHIRLVCLLLLSGLYSVIASAEDLAQTEQKPYTRNMATYAIPDAVMLDKAGNNISLKETIDYGGPVMMQFIFVTCPTICPILSSSFSAAQQELDSSTGRAYRMVSISIDPEADRPEKLNEYATRFKAGNNWYFLTGTSADTGKILKAFDATFSGNNKMFHKPLTFMRRNVGDQWVRIEGMLSKKDLLEAYKTMLASSPAMN